MPNRVGTRSFLIGFFNGPRNSTFDPAKMPNVPWRQPCWDSLYKIGKSDAADEVAHNISVFPFRNAQKDDNLVVLDRVDQRRRRCKHISRTFWNDKDSWLSATQSHKAFAFPIPPFPAKRCHTFRLCAPLPADIQIALRWTADGDNGKTKWLAREYEVEKGGCDCSLKTG